MWNIQGGTGCVRGEDRKLDVCDVEEFGRLESSEKNIAILGDKMVAADGETGRGQDKQTFSM